MGHRRLSRELALQTLYLVDTCALEWEDALRATFSTAVSETVLKFSRHLVEGVLNQKDGIDELLSRYTQNWDLKRMAAVDRNILRLATFEILNDLETPVSVVIDEAIEVAKTYSTEDSGKFVNGILDKIQKERKEAPKP